MLPIGRISLTNRLLFLTLRNTSTSSTTYEAVIEGKLRGASELAQIGKVIVEDRSGGCGANFYIHVESTAFRGKPRIQQHRIVQQVLKDEIAKWHAVSIDTVVPPQ